MTGTGTVTRWDLQSDRYVRAHLDEVDMLDIERRLGVSLPPVLAMAIVQLAEHQGASALTMWQWLEQFDASLLALAIGSGMGQGELERGLVAGPRPRSHLRLV